MSDRPVRRGALSPTAIDVGLTVLALAGQVAPFVFTTRSDGGPWTVLEFFPVLLVALPLLWRRRVPVTCLLVTVAGVTTYAFVGGTGPEQPIWYGALVAMYTVAERSSKRPRLVVLVASAVGVAVVGGLLGSLAAGVREALLWSAAYALGRGAHLRRANAAMLEERAARLERERELESERSAERERVRIARDMHDILGHAVSLMVVQAEAGPVVVRSDPARAEAAFDAVAAAGRDAMAQLRRMLGMLTEGEGPRAPQPSLERLAELVSAVGPHVALVTRGEPRALSAEVEVAAYRIVQEALTNVVKHAGPCTASVVLEWRPTELAITICDDGTQATTSHGLRGGGHGLIGVRERAVACGGSASFGARPDGPGFQVSVRLPVS